MRHISFLLVLAAALVAIPRVVRSDITRYYVNNPHPGGIDGSLNAPYRGTWKILADISDKMPYGEVWNFTAPETAPSFSTPYSIVPNHPIRVYADAWDRSILRMYNGMDASGGEIDLTGHSSRESAYIIIPSELAVRFSLKAISSPVAAGMIAPAGGVHLIYEENISNGLMRYDTISPSVSPITASGMGLNGLDSMYISGAEMLNVSVGAARLVIPYGVTTDMIGETFEHLEVGLANNLTTIRRTEVVLPGWAESVYLPSREQFELGGPSAGPNKSAFGTPWPGHFVGYFSGNGTIAPDGTRYDLVGSSGTTVPYTNYLIVRPYNRCFARQASNDPRSLEYVRDLSNLNRVVYIYDNSTPRNWIHLVRNPATACVAKIETSDGRFWDISTDNNGYLSTISPGDGSNILVFESESNADGRRIEYFRGHLLDDLVKGFYIGHDDGRVEDGAENTKDPEDGHFGDRYEYHTWNSDGTIRTRATFRWWISGSDESRTDYVFPPWSSSDPTAPLESGYPISCTQYGGSINDNGNTYTTAFELDRSNVFGNVVKKSATLADGSILQYKYDAQDGVAGVTVNAPFGFLSSVTRTSPVPAEGVRTLLDQEYEMFWSSKLLYRPRLFASRDVAGRATRYQFDPPGSAATFAGLPGEESNALLGITFPQVALPAGSDPKFPAITFEYDSARRLPWKRHATVDGSHTRTTEWSYDSAGRVLAETQDAGGVHATTRYKWNDVLPSRPVTVIGPDLNYAVSTFDHWGRLKTHRSYLQPWNGTDPSGPFYEKSLFYDPGTGWLSTVTTDNKDQAGNPIVNGATLVTRYTHWSDGLLKSVEQDGAGNARKFWWTAGGLLNYWRDSSYRGELFTYDGRENLVASTPVGRNSAGTAAVTVPSLATRFGYDAAGNLQRTTTASGASTEHVYDHFDQLVETRVHPNSSGGSDIASKYFHDLTGNVIRRVVLDGGVLKSDTSDLFDEAGCNYESRTRVSTATSVGIAVDSDLDPLVRRTFDWTGAVLSQTFTGDSTVSAPAGNPDGHNLVIRTPRDSLGRVDYTTDSAGGRTDFLYNKRNQIIQSRQKCDDSQTAQTNYTYDMLGRLTAVDMPPDAASARARVAMQYDSRNQLVWQSLQRPVNDSFESVVTRVFQFDAVGNATARAVLANPGATGSTLDEAVDRVVRYGYGVDGRVASSTTYNGNSATPHVSTFGYDSVGRLAVMENPAHEFVSYSYTASGPGTGQVASRFVTDGIGVREERYDYDQFDRANTVTCVGANGDPDIVNGVLFDGLSRVVASVDPRATVTTSAYDLAGRLREVVEDAVAVPPLLPLARTTTLNYNRLGGVNEQIVGVGSVLQRTAFRYDARGRPLRVVFPDAPAAELDNPMACTTCERREYDAAGRLTTRIDPRGVSIASQYDLRGLLIRRDATVGGQASIDLFQYDPVARLSAASRQQSGGLQTASASAFQYTPFGDLAAEAQSIGGGAARTIGSEYDQSGLRTDVSYPDQLTRTGCDHTPLGLPARITVSRDGSPPTLLAAEYSYATTGGLGAMPGSIPARRTTYTSPASAPGYPNYRLDYGYATNRDINNVANLFCSSATSTSNFASLSYGLDTAGNPVQQVATGIPGIAGDSRMSEFDKLSRLRATAYAGNGSSEFFELDAFGNRHAWHERSGKTHDYAIASSGVGPANGYQSIDGASIAYDAAGNLVHDEDGRAYSYDEANRLTEVRSSTGEVLARYTYDAFGRRVSAMVAGSQGAKLNASVSLRQVRRYYLDSVNSDNVLCESVAFTPTSAGDVVDRVHLNGLLGPDERIATFFDPLENGGTPRFYLPDRSGTPLASADASGTSVSVFGFDATGTMSGRLKHDADGDGDIDLLDYGSLQSVAGRSSTTVPATPFALLTHDRSALGVADGIINASDGAGLASCLSGPDVPVDPSCAPGGSPAGPSNVPPILRTGDFGLHGRPVDVLADGKVLMYWRNRWYDPAHGRFLQRDPTGYADGPNLYEAFRSNPLVNIDPQGTDNTKFGELCRDIAAQTPKDPFLGSCKKEGLYLLGGVGEVIGGIPDALKDAAANLFMLGAQNKGPGDVFVDGLIRRENNFARLTGEPFSVGRMLGRAPSVVTCMDRVAAGWEGFDLAQGGGEFVYGWENRGGLICSGAGQGVLFFAAPLAPKGVVTGGLIEATESRLATAPAMLPAAESPAIVSRPAASSFRFFDIAGKELRPGSPVLPEKLIPQVGGLPTHLDVSVLCSAETRFVQMANGDIKFRGMIVQVQEDLTHISTQQLEFMAQRGASGTTIDGETIVLHHVSQSPSGPLWEIPASLNDVNNRQLHPFGNTTGAGLTGAQRAAYNEWRILYWKGRAEQELLRRAFQQNGVIK